MTHGRTVPGRMGLVATSGLSILSLTPIAFHQLGVVRHLPDPPLRFFDSDSITCSRMAHPFGVPDSLLGIVSYGVTLAVAMASTESSTLRRALAAKVAFDGGLAATNTVRQIVTFRKICFWCMGTVASSAVSVWIARKLLADELQGSSQ